MITLETVATETSANLAISLIEIFFFFTIFVPLQFHYRLQKIKDAGAKAGIALNPGTSFETVKELLYLCDYVMLMSVNPGFAGQKYLDFVTPKFRQFVDAASNYGGYQVMIDGACSPEKIAMLSKVGVKGFILGTSALFGKEKSYKEIITELRKL